ncbi:MAG: hypothetical protein KAH46_21350 [Mycobacterium sp.]|jgi:hypothetical protein|nr:hypothetical protein [Mycobacterium sp.]
MPVQVDATHLSKVITEVRDLAETVRTYGSGAEATIAFDIPAALHVIAARLESEMRSWAQTEGTLARLFDEQQGGKAIRFPELRAVLTYVTPSPVSRDVQLAELRGAGTRLRALAGELGANMKTQSAPKFVELLQDQAAAVMAFADGLG